MRKLLVIIGVLIASLVLGNTFPGVTQIVGFAADGRTISSAGWYSVQLLFDPVGSSRTMNKVLEFAPSDAVIGDELEFVCEGGKRVCRIVSFKDGVYQLRMVGGDGAKVLGFADIPFRKKFNLHHRNRKSVTVQGRGNPLQANGKVTNDLVVIKKLDGRK